jgi:Protein of unknown function (DUF3224)
MKSAIILTLCVCASLGFYAHAQTKSPVLNVPQKETRVAEHAKGTFEVKTTPQPPEDKDDPNLGRYSLEKKFHGDLEGTSKAQMLTAGTAVKGSAGYVAIEKVTGTLRGRSGSFVFQHLGIMTQGVPQLSVTVVPDSGTGELVGISGKMDIIIADGKHSYDFEYSIP